MLLEQVGMMAQKIGKCFLEPPTASPRRSDRANASGTGAEAFSAMKLRPFPARISETVRNIDRARLGHPRLEAAPEVEAVAIMTAEKSCRHHEGHANGKHGCAVQHRVAGPVLLVP